MFNIENVKKPFSSFTTSICHVLRRPFPAYALLCAAIAVMGSTANGDWTQYRFDPAHHGLNPNETILSPATVGGLTVKWRVSVDGGGKLYALDKNTGQQLWSFPPDPLAGDFSTTTSAVANGIVYFGVNRGGPVVYAVDAATGARIWSHGGPISQIISSPTLLDGRVYLAFTDGSIRALDAVNGQITWNVNHPGGAYSSPAVASNQVDIYRDGVVRVRTANDGFHTDSTGGRGQASYRYKVCEAGTLTCSNEVTVNFGR